MTNTTAAWVLPLTETNGDIPVRGEVRGSRCRTSRALFAEWADRLRLPDHFGHNWDALLDCLHDTGSGHGASRAIIVREARELLADEPEDALAVLGRVLSEVAGDHGEAPRLLLLLDDTPDHLCELVQRMAKAGWPTAPPGTDLAE
ncbi:barstar family protein [Streptomyces sp. NPDC091217]|uniref:barstar family protein n=1 Tax=Streptomyces sp. NPDC091217 TaxID=3365975 RepID=UPI00382CC627